MLIKVIQSLMDAFNSINNVMIPTGNLGAMRSQMPQIDQQYQAAYVAWLETQGVKSKRQDMPVAALKLAQNEINKSKVFKLMQLYRDGKKVAPIIVSSDGFVIDGSHRFVAVYNVDKYGSIPTIRVEMQAMALIALTQRFPRTKFRSHSDGKIDK